MSWLLLALLISIAPPAEATVIVFDGKSLAADSQMTMGQAKYLHMQKLVRIGQYVVGCAGDCSDIRKFRGWFADQKKPKPKLECMSELVLSKLGCWKYDEDCDPVQITRPFAIGTGRVAAMAAMKAGATAV